MIDIYFLITTSIFGPYHSVLQEYCPVLGPGHPMSAQANKSPSEILAITCSGKLLHNPGSISPFCFIPPHLHKYLGWSRQRRRTIWIKIDSLLHTEMNHPYLRHL